MNQDKIKEISNLIENNKLDYLKDIFLSYAQIDNFIYVRNRFRRRENSSFLDFGLVFNKEGELLSYPKEIIKNENNKKGKKIIIENNHYLMMMPIEKKGIITNLFFGNGNFIYKDQFIKLSSGKVKKDNPSKFTKALELFRFRSKDLNHISLFFNYKNLKSYFAINNINGRILSDDEFKNIYRSCGFPFFSDLNYKSMEISKKYKYEFEIVNSEIFYNRNEYYINYEIFSKRNQIKEGLKKSVLENRTARFEIISKKINKVALRIAGFLDYYEIISRKDGIQIDPIKYTKLIESKIKSNLEYKIIMKYIGKEYKDVKLIEKYIKSLNHKSIYKLISN